MKITLTLNEAMDKCDNWDDMCAGEGLNPWACAEGFGHTMLTLTKEQAECYGIIKGSE